jgi:DNA (cytosine-5)-methyltransferase 1
MAFEQEGFCIVRGPDILLGGDIRNWSIPANRFDGIIGGPPCKIISEAVRGQVATTDNLIPEFTRIVKQGNPKWWLMENVLGAPHPELFPLHHRVLDAHDFGCNQIRVRCFWSNLDFRPVKAQERPKYPWPTVLATEHKYGGGTQDRRRAGRRVGRRMTLEEVNEAMGLPVDFITPALSVPMQYEVRGNGVPLQLGRAIAKAIKECL